MMDLLGSTLEGITGKRVLIEGELIPATIMIKDGKIADIIKQLSTSDKFLDAGDFIVMPGIFDSHVHVNEPGRTSWEGFETATKAALAGGVTTIIDMPLNSIPPTTTMENLRVKLEAAEGKCYTDVGFWGGVVPGNADSLQPMIEKGVVGFKCFLIHSGVDEFPCVNEEQVDLALQKMSGRDAVLAFHAEVDCGTCGNTQSDPNLYKSFLESRPDEMELEAIKMIDRQLRKHKNVRCHIVHLSTSKALPIISKLKEDGLSITVETCPHYLTLKPEEISQNQTQYKCCPPIRDTDNQHQLWSGLKAGLIDMIVSDHSPCTAELKKPGEKNFMDAWGGIRETHNLNSNERLSIIWSQAKERGFNVSDLSNWMSTKPATLAGMSDRKGKLEKNFDADIVVWDDKKTSTVSVDAIHHKNKITPYLGKTLSGGVKATILRGKVAYVDGTFQEPPVGKLLIN